jgi:hypothetical protein
MDAADSKMRKRHCMGNRSTKIGVLRWEVNSGDENVLYGRSSALPAATQGPMGRGVVFRIADIDAPRMDQPYGHEAGKC